MKRYANVEARCIVTEKRELKSEKNADWRGYIVKGAVLGQQVEFQCEAREYAAFIVGDEYRITAKLEEQKSAKGTFTRFVVANFCRADELVNDDYAKPGTPSSKKDAA